MITIHIGVSLSEQTFGHQKLMKFEMNFNQAKSCVKIGCWFLDINIIQEL